MTDIKPDCFYLCQHTLSHLVLRVFMIMDVIIKLFLKTKHDLVGRMYKFLLLLTAIVINSQLNSPNMMLFIKLVDFQPMHF